MEPGFRKTPEGIYVRDSNFRHRDEDFDPAGFAALRDMQTQHFWYRGRHRFVRFALQRALNVPASGPRSAIDLGAGTGGWMAYLRSRSPELFDEWAVADSSVRALELSRDILGAEVDHYQIDLLNLEWDSRWHVAFLLDVIEHLDDDRVALEGVRRALRPGGLLFVTVPALSIFWTYNDEVIGHRRRYSRVELARVASDAGFRVRSTRYFMFLLSPALLLTRIIKRPDTHNMTRDEVRSHLMRTHRLPSDPPNRLLRLVFSLETPAGHWLPFPWGTSLVGVFEAPR